jgi:hypothetical protein
MPVTITTATHAPKKWNPRGSDKDTTPANTVESLLQRACPSEHKLCESILQSSFNNEELSSPEAPIYASSNGFVRAAVSAYSNHHHLAIRPEDVWFSILTQLGFFVNANAEDLRSFFVSHEGKKELTVEGHGDFGEMAARMTEQIEKNVLDPELKTWIMPDFSTTKESDSVVAAILMMGALQQYFEYRCSILCGIPSVTLLGDRADWEKILNRLDMLPRLGSEPTLFCGLLKPILGYFIQSFNDPSDPAVLSFWARIAHRKPGGSGPTPLCGWITAFCFWNRDGKCRYTYPKSSPDESWRGMSYSAGCDLDGTLYHCIDADTIPDGSAAVPVTVDDNGHVYKARMVAGSVGIRVTSSGDVLDSRELIYITGPDGRRVSQYMDSGPESGSDSLQPVSGWWMYKVVEHPEGGTSEDEQLLRYSARWRNSIAKNASENNAVELGTTSDKNVILTGI